MTDVLPLTYTEAIIAIAARDPALCATIIHLHDCVEGAKADIRTTKTDVTSIKRDVRLAVTATIGTLFTVLGFVLWAVITHGLKA